MHPSSEDAASRALLPHVVARSLGRDGEAVRRSVGEHLALSPDDAVLELGCGDGRLLLELLARTPRGFVAGVAPEELMVRHATARTRRFIAGGRLQLVTGRSSDLSSFPDDGFDKACAVDVVYFWSEPERDLREILRVLRPGGRLVLGYAPRTDRARSQEADIARPTAQVEDWLGRAGFNEITSVECHDDARGAVMSWTQAAKPSRSPRTRTTK